MLITKCLLLFLFIYGKNIVETTDTSAVASPSSVACADSDSETGGSDSGLTFGKEPGSDDQGLTVSGANEADGSTEDQVSTSGVVNECYGSSDDQGLASGGDNVADGTGSGLASPADELKVFKADSNSNPVQIEATEFYEDQYLDNLTYAFKPGVKCTLVMFEEKDVWKTGQQGVDEPKSVTYDSILGEVTVRDADKSVHFAKDSVKGEWKHVVTMPRTKTAMAIKTAESAPKVGSPGSGSSLSRPEPETGSTDTPGSAEASEEIDESSDKEPEDPFTVASPEVGSTNEVSKDAGLRGTSGSADASGEEEDETASLASGGADTSEEKEKEDPKEEASSKENPDEKETSADSDDASSSHVGTKSTDPGLTSGEGQVAEKPDDASGMAEGEDGSSKTSGGTPTSGGTGLTSGPDGSASGSPKDGGSSEGGDADGSSQPTEGSQSDGDGGGKSDQGDNGIKLFGKDPSDASKTVELNDQQYDLKELSRRIDYELKSDVKCTLITIDGKELWKHGDHKCEDYPKSVSYRGGRTIVIHLGNGFVQYTKSNNTWKVEFENNLKTSGAPDPEESPPDPSEDAQSGGKTSGGGTGTGKDGTHTGGGGSGTGTGEDGSSKTSGGAPTSGGTGLTSGPDGSASGSPEDGGSSAIPPASSGGATDPGTKTGAADSAGKAKANKSSSSKKKSSGGCGLLSCCCSKSS